MGTEDIPTLTGGFAPVVDEIVADVRPVEGELPAGLDGLYVRNGPNRRFAAPGRYHWFDGDGMLHALRFERGRVQYRNRWLATTGLCEEIAAGRALWAGVKDPPRRDRPDAPLKNTANTSVEYFAGELLAMWYLGGSVYRADAHTLETRGVLDADPRLAGLPISAHSKVDERTGELVFFAYGRTPPYMHYGVLGRDGALKALQEVPLPGPRLPHDMAVTPNWSVLHDLPLLHDEEALAAGRHKLAFHPERPSRFGLVPRHGGPVRWFEAAPTYLYHVGNAWEEGDEVVMTGTPFRLPHDARGAVDGPRLVRMLAGLETDCVFHEWRFDLKTGRTRERTLDDLVATEFPVVDGRRRGLPTRYSWHLLMGRSERAEDPRFGGLACYDRARGRFQAYHEGPHCWWSEPAFAPRTADAEEGDGWLVGFVWDGATGRSSACVFDATDLARGPLCRIALPQRVPHGFHATWVGGDRLRRGW